MLHKDRIWRVESVTDAATLAAHLTEMTWTGCSAFERNGLLYLNDSTSGDGAQEYAVIRRSDMRQIESVTFRWTRGEDALDWIRSASPEMEPQFEFVLPLSALDHPVGPCYLCA